MDSQPNPHPEPMTWFYVEVKVVVEGLASGHFFSYWFRDNGPGWTDLGSAERFAQRVATSSQLDTRVTADWLVGGQLQSREVASE